MSETGNGRTLAEDAGKANGITEVMNELFLCAALNATESLRSTREDQK